jgi:hypothetical protein
VEKFHFAIKADAQFLSNPIDLWRRSPPVVIEQLLFLKNSQRITQLFLNYIKSKNILAFVTVLSPKYPVLTTT